MTDLQRLLYRELYRRSLYEFVKDFWEIADPAPFVDGKLIQVYCEIFQYMSKDWIGYKEVDIDVPKQSETVDVIDVRQGKRNLCLMVPPRHTKSMIFNVMAPVWLWISHPIKVASVSHTGRLAGQMNSKRNKIINSEKFKELFSDIVLTINTANALQDERGGELYSINREAFTGYGGDIIINDDLTNAETARKDQKEMSNAWSYYRTTMPSRINNLEKCMIMNIQQRLAPNDVAGHILEDSKLASTYVFVTLPAVFEKDTYVVCPISGDVVFWAKGDVLWRERFGDYSELKYQVGDAVFQTQYLQKPVASDKTVIKEDMIVEKDLSDVPDISCADVIYASHDFPVKDKDTSDKLGSVLAYTVDSTLYITDCLEKKMAFVKSVEYVKHLDEIYAGAIQIIEDKANGSPILQQLQDCVAGMQAFNPGTSSKMQRLESASLYMQSKNVVFVKNVFDKITSTYHLSESLQNLKKRLLNFPFVEHDDIVDAFTMLVLFVFMDKRFAVYGRAFNSENVLTSAVKTDYSTIFFNRDGDFWKVAKIGIQYAENSKIIVEDELQFKASIDDAFKKIKEFVGGAKVLIDCSTVPALNGMFTKMYAIERYEIADFDKSVAHTNLLLSEKRILLSEKCKQTKADICNFKFAKTKDETAKYVTTHDGFVACVRTALNFFGI